jgi:hypothetical protein
MEARTERALLPLGNGAAKGKREGLGNLPSRPRPYTFYLQPFSRTFLIVVMLPHDRKFCIRRDYVFLRKS